MSSQDDLYKLVENFCTIEQVKDLLRIGKQRDDGEVRITAENKSDLINRNLRTAVDSKAVLLDQVYDLVRNAEENGRQHIHYYKVPKKLSDALTMDHVGSLIWGAQWAKKIAFPRMDLKKNDFIYADFRPSNPTKKPRDWTLKLYGHEEHERFTGHIKEEEERLYKEFVREDLRIVLLMRFNSPDLLEVRIQSDTSRRRMQNWTTQLWSMVQRAIQKQQLVPWDLIKVRHKMIREADNYPKIYHLRDTRLLDKNGMRISFEPHATQASLFASVEVRDAVDGLLKAESDCTHLSIIWRAVKDGIPTRDLPVLLGDREPNEMIVLGSCEAKDLDYVTEQLRYFSR